MSAGAPALAAGQTARLAPAERSRLLALLFGMNLINYVVSPSLAGLLRDRTGEWTAPFLTAAAALLIASLVLGFGFRAQPLQGTSAGGEAGR